VKSILDIATAKRMLREQIWSTLETKNVARFPLPCCGRIPNFEGSERAAERIRTLAEWRNARVVFVSPDYAQRKVRENVLMNGKILIMASPRLKFGFVIVHPRDARGLERNASTIKGALRHGRTAHVEDIPKPELIVEGSVAVDRCGNRLGMGGGYGDVEISTLKQRFGLIPIVTTVHDLQVVDAVPFDEKDEKISIIVTPTRIIRISGLVDN
jgi:5-formyltetrahydrofolate cyclo-ligase